MKRLAFIFCVLAAFALSSCSGLWAPEYAENNDVLEDVYNKTYEIYLGEDMYLLKQLFAKDISQSEKIGRVELFEWNLNESMQGNTYTGYYIIYRVQLEKKCFYSLVDFTEFDSGRYEWKVIDADESLSAIQSMLY